MKPWYGVVPARVVGHNDPAKMGRVQVQYYWQEDGNANWARMVTPHAGSDRGFMFMPEVGDEVVVAFEDGDLERPGSPGLLMERCGPGAAAGILGRRTARQRRQAYRHQERSSYPDGGQKRKRIDGAGDPQGISRSL